MAYRNVIFPLVGTGNMSQYATGLSLTMDSNYVISAQLTNKNGEYIGTEQTIDLPLESVIVSGSYDSNTQSLILTLDNGNEITIPVGDLVSGLQTEITSQNPLSADLLTDGNTNKVFTATEQTKLSGLAPQVQSDWNQSDNQAVDYIKNKPTIPAAQVNADWNAVSGVAQILNKPTIPAAQIQSDWNQSNNQSVDYIKNKPTIDVTAAGDNTFTGNNTFSNDTLIGDWNDIALNLSVNTYGMPQIEGQDANTYKGFYINTDGIVFNDANLGDDTGLGITLDSSTGDVTVYAGFGGIDLQAPTVSVYGNPVATTDMLATVATTGDYDDLTNKPTIPAAQVNADWNAVSGVAQILNKPDLTTYATKTEVNTKDAAQDSEIATKIGGVFMTQQEFNQITPLEGENYFVENTTVEMVVTFTDQTTATYYVVVE